MKPLSIPTPAETTEPYTHGPAGKGFPDRQLFHFPDGIPAFEEAKQFLLICKPESRPLVFLRALEPVHLGFVCVDPFLICPGYQPRISDADTAFLELTSPTEVLLLSIVNPAPDVRQTTANLMAPLAINLRTGRGKQILCDRQDYPVRYLIWDALEQLTEAINQRATIAETNRSAA